MTDRTLRDIRAHCEAVIAACMQGYPISAYNEAKAVLRILDAHPAPPAIADAPATERPAVTGKVRYPIANAPAEQEPVAWLCFDQIMKQKSVTLDRDFAMYRAKYSEAWTVEPLYAHPAPDGAAALDRLIAERVREAVEAEREACAKIAEHPATPGIAAAIRARGSKENPA